MSGSAHHQAGTFDYKPQAWQDAAACAGHQTEWWFPVNDGVGGSASTETTATAKAICASCPVATQCLDYALRTESGFNRFGIFGGLTPDARRRLAREAS